MLTPENIATCSKGVKPKQPEVRITIERANASPQQLAAWRHLWAKLLAPPTTVPTDDSTNKGEEPRSANGHRYEDAQSNTRNSDVRGQEKAADTPRGSPEGTSPSTCP